MALAMPVLPLLRDDNAGVAPRHVAVSQARTGTVRTDTFWAQSLGTTKALTVYLPPSYSASSNRRYPVLVYLHGLGGNERNWVDVGRINKALDSLFAAGKPEAIVVMPDGDDGWYTTWNQLPDLAGCRADQARKEKADDYCVPWPHYDDYIASDVVKYVDGHYRTRADRAHRGIGGLSMGGLGAVALAFQYPGVFAAAASHSGVLSPRTIPRSANAAGVSRHATTRAELEAASRGMWKTMGSAFGKDTIGWIAREPQHLATTALARKPAVVPRVMIDCGVDDPFLDQSRDLHVALQRLGVSHQYAEWPGAHTWDYWRTHVPQSLEFLLGVVGTP